MAEGIFHLPLPKVHMDRDLKIPHLVRQSVPEGIHLTNVEIHPTTPADRHPQDALMGYPYRLASVSLIGTFAMLRFKEAFGIPCLTPL